MDARHWRYSLAGTHYALDDPGLPANFGNRPASFDSYKPKSRG